MQVDEAREDDVLIVELHEASVRRVEVGGAAGEDLARTDDETGIFSKRRVGGVEELPSAEHRRGLGPSTAGVYDDEHKNEKATAATGEHEPEAFQRQGCGTDASYGRRGVGIKKRP